MLSGVKSRWLDPVESVFLDAKAAIQISLEFETREAKEHGLETAFSSFNALKLRNGRFTLYESDNDPTIFKIPSELNDLEEVNIWMSRTHVPGSSNGLAVIAADDRRIVINASHGVTDGVYMAKLIEQINNPKTSWPNPTFPDKPMNLDYKEIMKQKDAIFYAGMEPNCLRLRPRVWEKDARVEMSVIKRNSRDLVSWDPVSSRIKGMSEAMWTSMALAGAAHQNNLPSPINLMTCVNRRNIIGRGVEAGLPHNAYAEVCVDANVSPNMTVREMGVEMRAAFNRAIADKQYNKFMKGLWKMVYRPWNFWFGGHPSGMGFDMSSVGPIRISKPVKDAYVTSLGADPHPGGLFCFVTFCLIDEERDRHEFIGQFDYSSLELSKMEGDAVTKAIEHCLFSVQPNRKLTDVITELRGMEYMSP